MGPLSRRFSQARFAVSSGESAWMFPEYETYNKSLHAGVPGGCDQRQRSIMINSPQAVVGSRWHRSDGRNDRFNALTWRSQGFGHGQIAVHNFNSRILQTFCFGMRQRPADQRSNLLFALRQPQCNFTTYKTGRTGY